MVLNSTTLLVSNRQDVSLDWVVREIAARGAPVVRLNTELAARDEWTLGSSGWEVVRKGERISLGHVGAVYYRRPEAPKLTGMGRGEAKVVRAQWWALLASLETTVGQTWMSRPSVINRAESKILQLDEAERVGFNVPATIVTNSRREALDFVTTAGGTVICKALDAPLFGVTTTAPAFVFASRVGVRELDAMADIEQAPIIFQVEVRSKVDIRVTVVGDRCLAAATRAQTIDWRQDPTARHVPYDLDPALASKCVELVRALGLRFSGIDLVMDERGTTWFLELNPNGEWGWLQAAGLPIAKAIVDALLIDGAQRE